MKANMFLIMMVFVVSIILNQVFANQNYKYKIWKTIPVHDSKRTMQFDLTYELVSFENKLTLQELLDFAFKEYKNEFKLKIITIKNKTAYLEVDEGESVFASSSGMYLPFSFNAIALFTLSSENPEIDKIHIIVDDTDHYTVRTRSKLDFLPILLPEHRKGLYSDLAYALKGHLSCDEVNRRVEYAKQMVKYGFGKPNEVYDRYFKKHEKVELYYCNINFMEIKNAIFSKSLN